MIDIAARFGDNLAHCRKLADLSQEELSRRTGLHRTEISQLERGLRLPRLDTIVKLCGSLEEPPQRLFEGIEWQPGSYAPGDFRLPSSAALDRKGRDDA